MSNKSYSNSMERGDISSLIIRNYLMFAAVVVVLTFCVDKASRYMVSRAQINSDTTIAEQQEYLENEKYDEVRLFGHFDITDGNGEVIYSSSSDKEYISKYEFVTSSGEKRYLMINQDVRVLELPKDIHKIYVGALFFFLVGFFAVLFFFVIRTTVELKKPIHLLQSAMNDLSSDSESVSLDYSGPAEFVSIADSFNDMSKKLSESERERKELESERLRLLTGISHDLRKPLSDIKKYVVEALSGQGGNKEEKELSVYQREYLEIIARKTDYLSDLVDSFYEYIKLQNPEYEIIKSNDDICEYVREYFAYKNPDLVKEGYNVHLDIPDTPIARPFDFVQMRRVLENILNNIMSCNPDGTDIYLTIRRRSNRAVICIGDDGIGVPDYVRDNLFKPFIVNDDVSISGKGTELGMNIAKTILEAHGATIRLMEPNESEHKTMFEIVL